MAPPPFESPHAPASATSPLTSADTRLTEPRETRAHCPLHANTRNRDTGRNTPRLDTASRFIQGNMNALRLARPLRDLLPHAASSQPARWSHRHSADDGPPRAPRPQPGGGGILCGHAAAVTRQANNTPRQANNTPRQANNTPRQANNTPRQADDHGRAVHPPYYTQGPGRAHDAAVFLASKKIALVGLDNPFTDAAVNEPGAGPFPPTPDLQTPTNRVPDLPLDVQETLVTLLADALVADYLHSSSQAPSSTVGSPRGNARSPRKVLS
jgi:hypothetical protein